MEKKTSSIRVTDGLPRSPGLSLRMVLVAVVYLFVFIVLDLFSQKFKELQGVVAWYPPAGLSYTLLIVFGMRFTPAVMVALLIDIMFVFRMPQPFYQLFIWALVLSLIYCLAAGFLRRRIHIDWQLGKLRDVMWLATTAVVTSALLAVLSVLSSAVSSSLPRSEIVSALFTWWIGETVGVLTVTPFLCIHVIPWLKGFVEGRPVGSPKRRSSHRSSFLILGQSLSIAFLFYWVFIASGSAEFRPMYLITLPLIWIALTHGSKGVTAGIVIVNFGASVVILLLRFDLEYLSEFELMMIINCIVGLFMGAAVTERRQAEEEVRALNENLEERVRQRTAELSVANKELEAFCYSVAHDLRTPLRSINGFSQLFLDKFGAAIPEEGRKYIERAMYSSSHMGRLLDALLDLKKLTHSPLSVQKISLSALAAEVLEELTKDNPQRNITIHIEPDMVVFGDRALMRNLLVNLLGNALKFTSTRECAHISMGTVKDLEHGAVFFVRDDGVGFNAEYKDKLFMAFQRLHSAKEFPGMGIGLATVQRIIRRHGGDVWAESKVDGGATFYFTIPDPPAAVLYD